MVEQLRRRASPEGRRLLMHFEGYRSQTYLDQAGVATICVGHALRPGESFPNGQTREQCDAILKGDLGTAENAVDTMVKVPLSQDQTDALISLVFNIGTGHFAESTVLRELNQGRYEEAADAFSMWCKRKDPKTGQLIRDEGLLARRYEESALFRASNEQDVFETARRAYELNFSLSELWDMRTGEEIHEAA